MYSYTDTFSDTFSFRCGLMANHEIHGTHESGAGGVRQNDSVRAGIEQNDLEQNDFYSWVCGENSARNYSV